MMMNSNNNNGNNGKNGGKNKNGNNSSKSELQELCQKRGWAYPEYTTEREGPNHNPNFKTTVTVNGVSFESPTPSKLLRVSQAEAANLALQFFRPPNPPIPHSSSSATTVGPIDHQQQPPTDTNNNIILSLQDRFTHMDSSAPEEAAAMQHLYKSQLQAYAQKRGLPLPEYACTPDGPPHHCRFTCTVTVANLTYHSPLFFPTVKESENAAAKLALLSLLPPNPSSPTTDAPHSPSPQVDNLPVYKNLLQELSQKQSFPLPTYTTQTHGLSHIPTFEASVLVKGQLFQGAIAKTKKQAEMNAAKAAYTILTQRGTSQNREFTPSTSQPHEAKSSDLKSQFIVDSQENLKLKSPLISNMDVLSQEGSEQGRAGNEESKTIASITVPAVADMLKLGMNNNPSSESSRKRGASEIPAAAAVLKVEQPSGSGNDGRCKKVCIFPRKLNMELPPGKTVFSDDRWIAIETSQAEAT